MRCPQITFPDLERVTGDVFIGKYEFCLIDGTCSDQQYNDNLDTLTFGEDIVIEQDLEVKENAQLPRVSFQRTLSVGGSVSQNSNGSNFCFQSANNASILNVMLTLSPRTFFENPPDRLFDPAPLFR